MLNILGGPDGQEAGLDVGAAGAKVSIKIRDLLGEVLNILEGQMVRSRHGSCGNEIRETAV